MNSRDLAELVSQHTERNGRKIPATFIYAQMAHETGGFKSELALKHNNFGGVTQVAPNGLDQPDGSNYSIHHERQFSLPQNPKREFPPPNFFWHLLYR